MTSPSEAVGRRVELAPGYDIARIVVGGWQLASGHHAEPVGVDEAIERLVALADLGLDTFDCADIYPGVEELYGRFLSRWLTTSGGARPIRVHTKLVPDLSRLPEVDAAHVRGIVHRSLRRLGVDALDLVQFYWWDAEVGDWLGAARTLGDLVRAGKIRHLGATNLTASEVRAVEDAAGVPVVADQVQYSVLDRRPEHALAAYCARSSTRMLCYGGLAGGLLTSRWLGTARADGPFSSRSLTKYRLIVEEFGGWGAYQALLTELAVIAEAHGVDAAAVALRFVLDQPGVAASIVGFTTVDRIGAAMRALDLRLDAAEHARVRRHTDAAPGPGGDVFGLERDRDGPHGRIMKYDLSDA
jgi:aryl-alcohol dehydrogenase-like predicted oxidoreductase